MRSRFLSGCGGIAPAVRRSTLLGITFLLALPLFAYYPFLHLRSVDNQWIAVPERFDLRQQPGGSVPVVVTRDAELALEDGDAWESVVSEVKLAAEQWSSVPRSALRLCYAGETTADTSANTPHVQVLFDELAPGVLAMGGPVESGEWREDASGPFKPIAKSLVILSADLRDRPSYGEAFFLTLLHEMGHALGLQHSFTSSTMATGITRSTTKAAPLAADDHAGIAALYPGMYFRQETGALRGRVTLGEDGLHFASVTALAATGEAISTLTLPDGSYEIQGIAPGKYYVYAQAVPESSDPALGPGQIVLPSDEAGAVYAPGPRFATRFFPDAAGPADASLVMIAANSTVEAINIPVQAAPSIGFRGATTYSFPGDFAVNPAQINRNGTRHFLLADGNGLTQDGQKSFALEVSTLQNALSSDSLFPYPWATNFLQVNLDPKAFETDGPKTLLWNLQGSTYVQPAAFRLVDRQPPRITSVTEALGDEAHMLSLLLEGDSLQGSARYLVEGHPATAVREANTSDAENASEEESAGAVPVIFRIEAPYTGDGRPVRLVALGSDGQSSLHLDTGGNRVASRLSPRGNVHLSRTSIVAGAETLVYVEADAPVFGGSRVGLDFGSPSLVATRVWKLADNRIAANVAVVPEAETSAYALTIHNDLALIPAGQTMGVSPALGPPLLRSDSFRDALTGDTVLYPGSIVQMRIQGEDRPSSIPVVLHGHHLEAVYDEALDCYTFQAPEALPLGLVEIASGNDSIGIEMDTPPVTILDAASEGRTNRLEEGGLATLTIRSLVELPESVAARGEPSGVRFLIGGRIGREVTIGSHEKSDRLYEVTAEIPLESIDVENGRIKIQVEWSGRLSTPYTVPLSRRSAAAIR